MKKKSPNKTFLFLLGILIGSLVIMLLMSNWFYQIPYSLQFKVNGYTEENAVAVCGGKSLEKTALCLNSFVKGIYKYKETDDNLNINFEKLVEVGGDCKNWNWELYNKLFNRLGFKTKKIGVDVSREGDTIYKHAFLIVYDKRGYCKVDIKDINCFIYGK